jgi:hypothetical protein
MRVGRNNRPLFSLPRSHPVIQFFEACSSIPWPESWPDGVEQEWDSVVEGRRCSFSDFMHANICFDVVLDGWLQRPNSLTPEETCRLNESLPFLRSLLSECEVAAMKDNNSKVIVIIGQIKSAFDLWEEAIRHRVKEDQLTL